MEVEGYVSEGLVSNSKGSDQIGDALSSEDAAWIDSEVEGYVSEGLVSNSKGSDQIGDALSSEDAAWIDSCLVNDPELSDSGWDALKVALLDIINSQSNSHFETLEIENGSHSRGTSGELLPMIEDEEAGTAGIDEDLVLTIEGTRSAQFPAIIVDDLVPAGEKAETARNRSYLRSDFLLNLHDPGENCDTDLGVDLWFTNDVHSSSDGIFKVWDLDTPTDEDGLVKQLKEAFAQSSLRAIPSTPQGHGTDSNEEALDDLISGIADLSLHQSSG